MRISKPTLLKILFWALALAAAVVLPLYACKVYLKTDYTDFFVYYRSAMRLKEQFYSQVYTLKDGASPFRYLPILLPLFRPFAELPLRAAQVLWYLCQFFWFVSAFFVLFGAARRIRPDRAAWATGLAVFFVLRFCLDTFTIGQVSSLMFLGYCLGLYGFVAEKDFLSGFGIAIPTLFKIGPGFSYLLYPFTRLDRCIRAWLAPLILTGALTAITILMLGSFKIFSLLNLGWLTNVTHDDAYYDASHYGSQALKSVLLRLVKSDIISSPHAYLAWGTVSVIGCSAVLWVWATRRAKDVEGQGLLFTLGVFPYLWFMPETFKYSLTVLALPVLMLFLSKDRSKLKWLALGVGIGTLSLAGKDLLPDAVFFGLQRASVPFVATLLIAAANLRLLWKHTVGLHEGPELPRPWEQLPVEAKTDGVSVLIPLGNRFPGRANLSVIQNLQEVLERRFGSNWELIWITPKSLLPTTNLRKLVERFPKSKIISAPEAGRGYSLREGFLHSSGRWIYLYRLEQPVDPSFFEKGFELLSGGCQLVRGNRREPETRFLIPVKNLSLAFGRHRLGLFFNRLVRFFLPEVTTSDTHSGHILLTRDAAAEIFALQTSGGFLFELELCVIARAHGYRECDLPVDLYLFKEKSADRILAEVLSILTGLPKLRSRLRSGCYQNLKTPSAITADDWGLSPAVNQGILELARKGVIRRVSLMANCRYLTDGLEELKAIPGIHLGLHFNLTYGRPLTPKYEIAPPNRLFFTFHRLKPLVQEELRAQLKTLKNKGVTIDYFDGHHHIHLIPGLFNSISPILREFGITTVRVPYDPALTFSKKFPLNILSMLLRRSVLKHGYKTMEVFYPQSLHFRDHGRMRAKLNRNPHAEIIVHPASRNDIDSLEFPDSYSDGRVREFRALQMLGYTQILSTEAEVVP